MRIERHRRRVAQLVRLQTLDTDRLRRLDERGSLEDVHTQAAPWTSRTSRSKTDFGVKGERFKRPRPAMIRACCQPEAGSRFCAE
jgi:hypothetical protein